MVLHLGNTFVLLACARPHGMVRRATLRLAARGGRAAASARCPRRSAPIVPVARRERRRRRARRHALPGQVVLAGLAQDVSPTAHFLVRLPAATRSWRWPGALFVVLAAAGSCDAADGDARRAARAVTDPRVVQPGAGLLNLALLAPVWMQIVHLLLADLLWIAFVLLAVRALSLSLPPR